MSHTMHLSCYKLLRSGEEFFPDLIASIHAAQHEIRLETYIFRFDKEGVPIACALESAAKRGVQVFLMFDGVGTPDIPQDWLIRWVNAGIHYRSYMPFGRLGLIHPIRWRRLHRKLCVFDRAVAYCGGINIIDDNFDPYRGLLESPRLDYAVRIEGALVAEIHLTMLILWRRYEVFQHFQRLNIKKIHATLHEVYQNYSKAEYVPHFSKMERTSVQERGYFIPRDNINNRRNIEKVYLHAIEGAQKEILIANAYFLPSKKFRDTLVMAAARGVKIKLLIQGRCDNFMQFHAVRPLLSELIQSKIEIYQYTHGFLHAKVAVVDEVWSTVGSSNLDPLSLLMAREANVAIESPVFASQLKSQLLDTIKSHCICLNDGATIDKRWYESVFDRFTWVMVRVLVRFFDRKY